MAFTTAQCDAILTKLHTIYDGIISGTSAVKGLSLDKIGTEIERFERLRLSTVGVDVGVIDAEDVSVLGIDNGEFLGDEYAA